MYTGSTSLLCFPMEDDLHMYPPLLTSPLNWVVCPDFCTPLILPHPFSRATGASGSTFDSGGTCTFSTDGYPSSPGFPGNSCVLGASFTPGSLGDDTASISAVDTNTALIKISTKSYIQNSTII